MKRPGALQLAWNFLRLQLRASRGSAGKLTTFELNKRRIEKKKLNTHTSGTRDYRDPWTLSL